MANLGGSLGLARSVAWTMSARLSDRLSSPLRGFSARRPPHMRLFGTGKGEKKLAERHVERGPELAKDLADAVGAAKLQPPPCPAQLTVSPLFYLESEGRDLRKGEMGRCVPYSNPCVTRALGSWAALGEKGGPSGDCRGLKWTSRRKRLIQESWSVILARHGKAATARLIFDHIFAAAPHLRSVFKAADSPLVSCLRAGIDGKRMSQVEDEELSCPFSLANYEQSNSFHRHCRLAALSKSLPDRLQSTQGLRGGE